MVKHERSKWSTLHKDCRYERSPPWIEKELMNRMRLIRSYSYYSFYSEKQNEWFCLVAEKI